MKLTYYGHSAFRIETQQARILVDPFFTGNVNAPEGALEEASKDLTHICLTHGHWDHVGDTVDLARKTGATVVCNVDLANWLKAKGVEKIDMGNTGGTLHHDGFSLTFVQAVHSAAGMDENGVSQDLGPANGLVFHFHDGPCIYHMGDTDIFGDMALIAELHQPDIGIVPIGDRFTMGGAVAALACKRYFEFKTVIPCHYGTFPIIDQSADTFISALDGDNIAVAALKPGEEFEPA